MSGRDGIYIDSCPKPLPPPVDPPPLPDPTVPDKLEISFINQIRLNPKLRDKVEIREWVSEENIQIQKLKIQLAFLDNDEGLRTQLVYVEEAFYFVPVLLALNLQRRGHYLVALNWFRSVYDYSLPIRQRKIYFGLKREESLADTYTRSVEWLLDPLNPHAIASTRANTYTCYTILSLVQCFLDFADAEYTKGTSGSVSCAHTLYSTALELLEAKTNRPPLGLGEIAISDLVIKLKAKIESEDPGLNPISVFIYDGLKAIRDTPSLKQTVDSINERLSNGTSLSDRLIEASLIVSKAIYEQTASPDFASKIQSSNKKKEEIRKALLRHPVVTAAVEKSSFAIKVDHDFTFSSLTGKEINELPQLEDLDWLREPIKPTALNETSINDHCPTLPTHYSTINNIAKETPLRVFNLKQKIRTIFLTSLNDGFCVLPNPIIDSLRLYIEKNLFKIRNCRNINGLEVSLEPYAAPIGLEEGISIGNRGEFILPSTTGLQPTLYRFKVLIERSKQLVGLAQQLEATFLSILEKRDAEFYNLIKAKQDINLNLAGVRLQGLRLIEVRDGVALADYQLGKARSQAEYYANLLDEGTNNYEIASMIGTHFSIMSTGPAGFSNLMSAFSGFERREQEWRQALRSARSDVNISFQQVRLAQDRVRIVAQELNIANLQADHSQETFDFLVNKFLSGEFYDWMSNVLESVYSTFLQHATSVAHLAANQLAFERQEAIPRFIQSDYWEDPLSSEAGFTNEGNTPDRRGLTGSARLLRDIFQLDQFAFHTDQRKQQLTKTISLAQFAPSEFQRFRETGVMQFITAHEQFERDFPGHYLRLIKRVRVSVIALIPPIDGIKSTLSNSGISRVVIGGNSFQETEIRRTPENVSLTASSNSTGLFELQQDNEKLLPFEGNGVATDWTLVMPKASNQFNYNTIADILITLEYTAINSAIYHQQVTQRLDRSFSADRPFSFRHELADQWYHLHNPEHTENPMTVTFNIRREDFPPNLKELRIKHIVLYFAFKDGSSFGQNVNVNLFFTPDGGSAVGGDANPIEGIISTRGGSGGNWSNMIDMSPFGEWSLALPDTDVVKNLFKDEKIENILFVITYEGRTPEWPS